MSKSSNSVRNRTVPVSSSPTRDPKLLLIKQRINQIASNMKNSFKSSNSSSTPNSHIRETRIRTPPKSEQQESETIEDFLIANGFEKYVNLFQDNQITLQDLPILTKEDLIDMKLPIGPRNRLLKLIENMDNNKRETISNYESSPKRAGLKDEVDKFMNELSQFSKRSENKFRHSSREQSLDASFDEEINSQRVCDSILNLLKEISDKQNFMMKAIEENQKAVSFLRQQYANSRKNPCSCSDYR